MPTINDVNKKVAAKLGVPESLVSTCNEYHWKYIRKNLSSPATTAMYIKWLGTFYVKPLKFFKRLFSYIIRIREARASKTIHPVAYRQIHQECFEGIKRLWVLKQRRQWILKPIKGKVYKTYGKAKLTKGVHAADQESMEQ